MKKLIASSTAAVGVSALIALSGAPAASALEIPLVQEPTISATVFEAGTTITFGGINASPNTEVTIDFDEPRDLAFIDEDRYTNPNLPFQQTIMSNADGVFSTQVSFPVPGIYIARGYWIDADSGRVAKVERTVEVTASSGDRTATGVDAPAPQIGQMPVGGVDTGVATNHEQPNNLGIIALGGGLILALTGASLRTRYLNADAQN